MLLSLWCDLTSTKITRNEQLPNNLLLTRIQAPSLYKYTSFSLCSFFHLVLVSGYCSNHTTTPISISMVNIISWFPLSSPSLPSYPLESLSSILIFSKLWTTWRSTAVLARLYTPGWAPLLCFPSNQSWPHPQQPKPLTSVDLGECSNPHPFPQVDVASYTSSSYIVPVLIIRWELFMWSSLYIINIYWELYFTTPKRD